MKGQASSQASGMVSPQRGSRRRTVASAILAGTVFAAPLLFAMRSPQGSSSQPAQGAAAADSSVAFYVHQVQPILEANCYRCHAGLNHRGGLQMDTPAGMLRGGHDGVVIVPGHPEQSLLVKLIRHEGPADDPMPMPPKSKLSDADIATITRWIQAGALMPPKAAE